MPDYLAIYTGSMTSENFTRWNQRDEAQRKQLMQEGMQAWGEWAKTHADRIVVQGAPLGKTKIVSPDGVDDIRNQMSGYTVVRADSHEAAAAMFVNHPHFTYFPGDAVEVMECMPMPGSAG